MNPIGLLLRLLWIVGLGDVKRSFFLQRKLTGHSVYGPGTILVGNNAQMHDCTFRDCDFIETSPDAGFLAALPMEQCICIGVLFVNVTFLCSPAILAAMGPGMAKGRINVTAHA